MDVRRIGALYLVGLGLACSLWWASLFLAPSLRLLFLPRGVDERFLFAFLLPDLALYIVGALTAGVGLLRRQQWAPSILLLHVGASVYASLYCLAVAVLYDSAWLSVFLMLPAAIASATVAWRLRR